MFKCIIKVAIFERGVLALFALIKHKNFYNWNGATLSSDLNFKKTGPYAWYLETIGPYRSTLALLRHQNTCKAFKLIFP